MAFNAIAQTFVPLAGPFAAFPVATQQPDGRTTAQLTANASFTKVTVTTAATLVEAAKVRNSMTLVVPVDALTPVTLDNNNSVTGPVNGFNLNPGSSLVLAPFNDPMYAISLAGSQSLFFMDA